MKKRAFRTKRQTAERCRNLQAGPGGLVNLRPDQDRETAGQSRVNFRVFKTSGPTAPGECGGLFFIGAQDQARGTQKKRLPFNQHRTAATDETEQLAV